jgi:hypothetical protein
MDGSVNPVSVDAISQLTVEKHTSKRTRGQPQREQAISHDEANYKSIHWH